MLLPDEEKREEEEVDIPTFEDEEEIEKALSEKAGQVENREEKLTSVKKEEKRAEAEEEEEEVEEVLPKQTKAVNLTEEVDFDMMRRILQMAEDRRRPILLQLLQDHVWVEKVVRKLGFYCLFHIFTAFGDRIKAEHLEALLSDPDSAANYLKSCLDEVFELYKGGGRDIKDVAIEARAVKTAYEVLITVGEALLAEVERIVYMAFSQINELRQKLAIALSIMDSDQRLEYIRKVKELGLSVDEVLLALGEHVKPTMPPLEKLYSLIEKVKETTSEVHGGRPA